MIGWEVGGAKAMAYDQIDKSPEEKAHGITVRRRMLKYETTTVTMRTLISPGPHDYVKEYDYRCSTSRWMERFWL